MSCKHEKPCSVCLAARHRHEKILRRKGVCFRHPNVKAVRGIRCEICIRRYEKHRDKQHRLGLCVVHPKRKVAPGKRKCELCLLTTRLSGLRKAGCSEIEVRKAEEAVKNFNGRCQCCGGKQDGFGAGAKKDFALEHDHLTKKFRGIVCAACNLTIGHAKENIERLKCIIRYLQRSPND